MTTSKHISCAKRDRAFGIAVDQMGGNKYKPWVVVAYYYSALHWVDAYFKGKRGRNFRDHVSRESHFSREALLRNIYSKYQQLATDSKLARYDGGAFKAQDTADALKYLDDIENHIRPLL